MYVCMYVQRRNIQEAQQTSLLLRMHTHAAYAPTKAFQFAHCESKGEMQLDTPTLAVGRDAPSMRATAYRGAQPAKTREHERNLEPKWLRCCCCSCRLWCCCCCCCCCLALSASGSVWLVLSLPLGVHLAGCAEPRALCVYASALLWREK